ncbi:MAG: hypothetical protein U0105_05955 [Candidatus Obscuribacterales bacterium]
MQQAEPLEDPRRALRLILKLCKRRHLPREAGLWASAALKQANGIFYRIGARERHGGEATPVHRALLLDIHTEALSWLKYCWTTYADILKTKA